MSCILRIIGKELESKDLLEFLTEPICTYQRGETDLIGKVITQSGANFNISEAGFDDFDKQKVEAIEFLKTYNEPLKKAMAVSGIDKAYLDFGVDERNEFAQSEYLESDLLKLTGDLGVGIKLTIYPRAEGEDDS